MAAKAPFNPQCYCHVLEIPQPIFTQQYQHSKRSSQLSNLKLQSHYCRSHLSVERIKKVALSTARYVAEIVVYLSQLFTTCSPRVVASKNKAQATIYWLNFNIPTCRGKNFGLDDIEQALHDALRLKFPMSSNCLAHGSII